MAWKCEYWKDRGYVAVYRKSGKRGFKDWMPWSEYVKLKKNRKRIKDEVAGFLQKYPKRLAKSYAAEWVMVTFGVPPGFGTAIQVFIETIRY